MVDNRVQDTDSGALYAREKVVNLTLRSGLVNIVSKVMTSFVTTGVLIMTSARDNLEQCLIY